MGQRTLGRHGPAQHDGRLGLTTLGEVGRERGTAGERFDRSPDLAWRPAAPAPRGGSHQPRGRRAHHPSLGFEDQPNGAGTGRLQGARRGRPARPCTGSPTRPSGTRCWRWPGRPTRPAGGTATTTCCRAGSRSYIGLEGAASLIRTYEIQFVPGPAPDRRTMPGRSAAAGPPRRTAARRSSAGSVCG